MACKYALVAGKNLLKTGFFWFGTLGIKGEKKKRETEEIYALILASVELELKSHSLHLAKYCSFDFFLKGNIGK